MADRFADKRIPAFLLPHRGYTSVPLLADLQHGQLLLRGNLRLPVA